MRIGILTLPLHTNFGGILQAYALQTILERMGHEASIITIAQRPFQIPLWKKPFSYGKLFFEKLKGKNSFFLIEKKVNVDRLIIEQNTVQFIKKYIRAFNINDIKDVKEKDFDAIVVGSDQVWRKVYFESTYYCDFENAFLSFTRGWDVKRIAYAASFGYDNWTFGDDITDKIANNIKMFDAVSVREKSGVNICRTAFGVNVEHVLDPVFLLHKEDYLGLLNHKDWGDELDGDMMVYLLDDYPTDRHYISDVANKNNLKPFFFDAKIDHARAPVNMRIQHHVEKWLTGFMKAKLVVTDSFHACVFSIIFKKPFVVLQNETRGNTRLESLLGTFNLKIDKNNPLSMDLDEINLILEQAREKSMLFLYNNLNTGIVTESGTRS